MGSPCKLQKRCTRLTAASDKVYQLLAHGRWFSPASSTTKTGRHDIAEILLKVALNTIKSNPIYHTETPVIARRESEGNSLCRGGGYRLDIFRMTHK